MTLDHYLRFALIIHVSVLVVLSGCGENSPAGSDTADPAFTMDDIFPEDPEITQEEAGLLVAEPTLNRSDAMNAAADLSGAVSDLLVDDNLMSVLEASNKDGESLACGATDGQCPTHTVTCNDADEIESVTFEFPEDDGCISELSPHITVSGSIVVSPSDGLRDYHTIDLQELRRGKMTYTGQLVLNPDGVRDFVLWTGDQGVTVSTNLFCDNQDVVTLNIESGGGIYITRTLASFAFNDGTVMATPVGEGEEMTLSFEELEWKLRSDCACPQSGSFSVTGQWADSEGDWSENAMIAHYAEADSNAPCADVTITFENSFDGVTEIKNTWEPILEWACGGPEPETFDYLPPGTVAWVYTRDDDYDVFTYSEAAVDASCTSYFTTTHGMVWAIDLNGEALWDVDLGSHATYPSTALGDNGMIYQVTDDKLVALSSAGELQWEYALSGQDAISTAAVGPDGTVFVTELTGVLHAVQPDGERRWIYDTGDLVYYSPVVAADGTVYFSSFYDSVLWAIKPDGTRDWAFNHPVDAVTFGPPALGADGVIYHNEDGEDLAWLRALWPDGRERWKHEREDELRYPAVVGPDGTVYVAFLDALVALDPETGAEEWAISIEERADQLRASPTVGADGTIYYLTGQVYATLNAVDNSGNPLWDLDVPEYASTTGMTILPNGILVLQTSFQILGIRTSSPGLADSPWPKIHGNLSNNGCGTED